MTELEKMIKGKLYDPSDKEVFNLRTKAHRLNIKYNSLIDEEYEEKIKILTDFGVKFKENAYFQGPIYFDYGLNISVGKNFYCNFNFTCLDICPVTIGDNVFIGPNVSIVTPIHPYLPEERNLFQKDDGSFTDLEYGKPITIHDNCWIASNVTVCGGVTIGEGCIIGAGSVVTKDIPPYSLACGNPCKVIRKITERDSVKNKPELY